VTFKNKQKLFLFMYKIFNPTLTIFSSLNQNLKINLQSYRFKKTKNKRKSNYKKNKLIKRFVARVEKKRRIRDKIVANQIFLEKFQAFNRNEYPEIIKRRIREYLPIIVRIYYFGTNRINLPKKEQKKTANKNFALDKKRTSLPKKEQKKTANKNFALDNKPRATFITITDEVSFPKPDYNRGPKWNIDMGESNLILRRLTNCSRGLPLVRNVSEKKTKDQRQEIVDKLIGERQTDLISEYCRQRKFENEIKTLYGSFGPQNELRKKYVLSILVLMQDLRIKKIEENLKNLLAQREAFSSFLDQEGRELIKAEGTVGAGAKFGFLLAEAEFCLKRFDFLGKKAEIWRKIVKEHGLNVKDRLVKIGKSKDWSVEINKFLDLLASLMKREINKDFKLAKKTRWHRDWNMLKAIRTAAHVLLLKDKRGNKEMYKEPLLCEDFEFLLKARWMEVIADALLLNDKRLIRKKETYKEPLLREDLEPQFIKIKGKTSKASSDEFSEHLYCLIGLKKANLSEALKARKSQVRLSLKKHREAKIKEAKKLKKKTLTKEKLKDRLEKKTENLSIALMKKKPRNKLEKKTLPVASSKVEKKAPSPEALIVLTNKKPRNELEKKTLPKSNAGKKAEILPATSSLKKKKPKNDLKKKVLTKKELRNELKKKALIRKKLKKKLEKARSKILTKSQLLKIKQLENIKKILETKRRKEIFL